MKKYKIGFIQGTFDLFHIGHLNLIEKAKEHCEYLIVGVNTDELVENYKHKHPVIPLEERARIVEALKTVDKVVIMEDRDKLKAAEQFKFNVIFMGDDWKGTDFYKKVETELKEKVGVDIIYFPYTKSTSSTILTNFIKNYIGDKNE